LNLNVIREGHALGSRWNKFPDPQNIRNRNKFGVVACVAVEIGKVACKIM